MGSLLESGKAHVETIARETPHSFTVGGHVDASGKVEGQATYARTWSNGWGLTAYAKAWWNDQAVTPNHPQFRGRGRLRVQEGFSGEEIATLMLARSQVRRLGQRDVAAVADADSDAFLSTICAGAEHNKAPESLIDQVQTAHDVISHSTKQGGQRE